MRKVNNSKVRADLQDRTTLIWKQLEALIISLAEDDQANKFYPYRQLNNVEDWEQLNFLPNSIGLLQNVETLVVYGSSLYRFPQEIGEMKNLKAFIPYTSYHLHWFPYEITRCKKLVESTVSTRALYGNYKNRKPFPDLNANPVNYYGGNKCSLCDRVEIDDRFEQYWISVRVATDVLPLLVISCSEQCTLTITNAAEGYYPGIHKGGQEINHKPPFPGTKTKWKPSNS